MSLRLRHKSASNTTALFSASLGLGAVLLFWIQPLVAKSLLPITGGSPAIWHTVIVFFQTTLLLGYAYAHLLTKSLPFSKQAAVHFSLLLVSIYLLPLDRFLLDANILGSASSNIPLQIWTGLFMSIGLPCFLISSTSPLLQSWYRNCDVDDADDPYFLYSSSNVGSLCALLGFPLFLEFTVGLTPQFRIWSTAFICLGFLLFLCYRRGQHHLCNTPASQPEESLADSQGQEQGRIKPWLAYSFLGSSVMIGATTFLTTSILNTPLMGILPLAGFLVTFVFAFSRRKPPLYHYAPKLTLVFLLGVLFQTLSSATEPAWLIAILHLGLVFFSCLHLHERLARSRPAASQITDFYFWMSLGGVAAGLFHTFVAPSIFNHIWEYPLTLIAIGFTSRLTEQNSPRETKPFIFWGLGTCAIALYACFAAARSVETLTPLNQFANPIIGTTLVAIYLCSRNPYRLATMLACLFLLNTWRGDAHGETLFTGRNFFGQSRVTMDPNGLTKRLIHGNTIHGRQSTVDEEKHLPLSYYHTSGPLRRIIKQYEDVEHKANVAVVGLGAGSMLYYAQAQQTWHLFEIDPLVISLAKDSGFFSYFESPGLETFSILEGDARVRIMEIPDDHFDLILLDAFSSDSIPLHLMTYEAMALYLSKLAEPGLIAFHISNRTLNLAPILARIARSFDLVTLGWNDPHEAPQLGKDPSHWVVLARSSAHLERLEKDDRWTALESKPKTPLWTDERSSMLEALSVFQ